MPQAFQIYLTKNTILNILSKTSVERVMLSAFCIIFNVPNTSETVSKIVKEDNLQNTVFRALNFLIPSSMYCNSYVTLLSIILNLFLISTLKTSYANNVTVISVLLQLNYKSIKITISSYFFTFVLQCCINIITWIITS